MRFLLVFCAVLVPCAAFAADIRVAPGGDIQNAIDQAMPGDVVILESGSYDIPELTSARDGTAANPITVRGEGDVLLLANDRVFDVQHAHFHIESVVMDAQFADVRGIRVDDGAVGFVLRNSEVRNTTRDCVDIRATSDVLIEGSLIHHCLNWDGDRVDAHGIVAGAVQGLTIRNTEIHTFTGDAFQVDPGRSAPGWNDVVIEGCTFWLAPVNDGSAGIPNGTVPGENAIDTKTFADSTGRMVIRNTTAYGFRGGLISNMAAFNLKEEVDVTIDGVTVYDSEIAFRIRGSSGGGATGARVSIANAVFYDVDFALRLESDLAGPIPLYFATFGREVGTHVRTVDGASPADLDQQNIVVLGAVPGELNAIEATEADFVSVPNDDYIPVATASWVDSGTDAGIDHDRRGAARPQGAGYDPGAFEFGDAPADDMGGGDDAGNNGAGTNNGANNGGSNNGGANNGGANNGGANNGSGGNNGNNADAGEGDADGRRDATGSEGCRCSTGSSAPASALLWLIAIAAIRRRKRR